MNDCKVQKFFGSSPSNLKAAPLSSLLMAINFAVKLFIVKSFRKGILISIWSPGDMHFFVLINNPPRLIFSSLHKNFPSCANASIPWLISSRRKNLFSIGNPRQSSIGKLPLRINSQFQEMWSVEGAENILAYCHIYSSRLCGTRSKYGADDTLNPVDQINHVTSTNIWKKACWFYVLNAITNFKDAPQFMCRVTVYGHSFAQTWYPPRLLPEHGISLCYITGLA